MMRVLLLLSAFCMLVFQLHAQEVKHSIYLIGDAGKDTTAGEALKQLEKSLLSDSLSTVLFLGDNVYPKGIVGKPGSRKRSISEAKLLTQLETTAQHRGPVFWIPGNHDWKAGRWKGQEALQHQELFIERFYAESGGIANDSGKVFFPKRGLPGPTLVRVGEHGYNIVFADVQWWLQRQFFHAVPKPLDGSKKEVEERFLSQLDSLLTLSEQDKAVTILAMHHPMYSNGYHGRSKQPWRFIMNCVPPFQLVGLLGLNRALVQDIPQPRYKRIRNKTLETLKKHKNVIVASGHEHNLQYFLKDGNHFLVSGSGSKTSSLKGDKYGAKFMDDRNLGYMRIDLMQDGGVRCSVFGHTNGQAFHEFKLY